MDVAFERVSREEIFEHTGIQFMELNTLYQLLAQRLVAIAAARYCAYVSHNARFVQFLVYGYEGV